MARFNVRRALDGAHRVAGSITGQSKDLFKSAISSGVEKPRQSCPTSSRLAAAHDQLTEQMLKTGAMQIPG